MTRCYQIWSKMLFIIYSIKIINIAFFRINNSSFYRLIFAIQITQAPMSFGFQFAQQSRVVICSYYYQIMEEDLQKSVNIQSFTYQHNLLAASRDSKIYLATTPQNKNMRPLAFKGYSEAVLNDPIKQKKLVQEIKFLWELSQKENIVQILSQHYRDRMVFIITQYCEGGSLAMSLKNYGAFNQQKAINYIKQIITGYRSISNASIIHRNLEPSNILISGLELKIADFSDAIERKDALLACKKEEIVGTLIFQAPEVLEKYFYSQKSDVYSIGLLFLTMLKGQSPFIGQSKAEILKHMKSFNVQDYFKQRLSNKCKIFLQKTLKFAVDQRMQVEEMLNYSFYQHPELPISKFFDFDTPYKSFSKVIIPTVSPYKPPSSKIIKLLEIINEAVPQKQRKTSTTSIRLKMSEELDFSRFQNPKEISIFIPSKLDIKQTNKSQKKLQTVKRDSDYTVEFQPSIMIIPSQKERSNSSKKSYTMFAKDEVIVQEKVQQSIDSTQIKPKVIKNRQFTARTLDTQRMRRKEQTLTPNSLLNSSKKGSQIKVFVHSPHKVENHPDLSQSTIKCNSFCESLDIEPLLSQINMTRFLSRTIYYVQKLRYIQNVKLQESLQGLRLKIFNQIRELRMVDQKSAELFKNSAQYLQLLQIISIYQSKCQRKASFSSFQDTIKLLQSAIPEVFHGIKASNRMNKVQVKALDHMVTCWQLITLLKTQNIQVFHRQSKVEHIINDKKEEAPVSKLLEVYERMLALKLIEK